MFKSSAKSTMKLTPLVFPCAHWWKLSLDAGYRPSPATSAGHRSLPASLSKTVISPSNVQQLHRWFFFTVCCLLVCLFVCLFVCFFSLPHPVLHVCVCVCVLAFFYKSLTKTTGSQTSLERILVGNIYRLFLHLLKFSCLVNVSHQRISMCLRRLTYKRVSMIR